MKLASNELVLDRIIRIVVGVGLVGLALAAGLTSPLLYGVWLVAVILVVTGIVGFCPLYAALRIVTRRAAR